MNSDERIEQRHLHIFTELATQPCGHVTKTLVINLFTMSKSRTTKRLAEARTFRNFFLSGDDSHSSDKKPNNRPKLKDGGARRDRTDDLKLAKLALSQLSYGPVVSMFQLFGQRALAAREKMVGLGRLELPTSRLSSARSNQLSYKPEPCTQGAWLARARDRARPGRKRNEDGGFPLDRPDWPCCSKCSNRRASSPGGTSLERR